MQAHVQCAKIVELTENAVPVVISIPPLKAENQPSKICSSFVGVGKANNFPSVPVLRLEGVTSPLLGSNVMVKYRELAGNEPPFNKVKLPL